MKTPPRPGELTLTHVTTNTGDTQSFGVNAANFKPFAVALAARMETEPVMGYMLEVKRAQSAVVFFVCREAVKAVPPEPVPPTVAQILTANVVKRDGATVTLETSILCPMMDPHEAQMLADLEQCAALALLEITPI